MRCLPFIFALSISVQPLVDADVLEPSVQNEVDHALAKIPATVPPFANMSQNFRDFCTTNDFFETNKFSRTDCAIRLVSKQRSDGRWFVGTNDVTSAVREILLHL